MTGYSVMVVLGCVMVAVAVGAGFWRSVVLVAGLLFVVVAVVLRHEEERRHR